MDSLFNDPRCHRSGDRVLGGAGRAAPHSWRAVALLPLDTWQPFFADHSSRLRGITKENRHGEVAVRGIGASGTDQSSQ